jgi:hypothetical protein
MTPTEKRRATIERNAIAKQQQQQRKQQQAPRQ